MNKTFLIKIDNSKGALVKRKIINYYINNGNSTITDLSRELDLSVPTVTKFINEMSEDGYLIDYGKVETSGGRYPNLYGLNPQSGYFVGVHLRRHSIDIGMIDFKGETVELQMNIPFVLENSVNCLNELCLLISKFIERLDHYKDKVINININVSGRVNPESGYSYSIFFFEETPLSDYIQNRLGYNVTIDNDTRAMAYGEYILGDFKQEKNILFVNISWGLGLGIIIDGKLYHGKSGFSGEMGHISTYDNEIICHCGKKGCLETEASGSAMYRVLHERIKDGASSILSDKVENGEIYLHNIIDAVNKEDMLCIDIVEDVAQKLGKQIAGMINLFNPEVVIIGGSVSSTGDYILQPIKSAVRKYSLNLVNKDSAIVISKLKDKAGILGACMLARLKVFEG